MQQSVTFSFTEDHDLNFTFTYGDMALNHTIYEPFLDNNLCWQNYINELGEHDTLSLQATEEGDHTVCVILPKPFVSLYISALQEAIKDPRARTEL